MKRILFSVLLLPVISVCAFSVDKAEYRDILVQSSAFYFMKKTPATSDVNIKHCMDKYEKLEHMPISESLPLMMEVIEEYRLTNEYIKVCDSVVLTNYVAQFANYHAFRLVGLTFGLDSLGHVAFPWLSGKGDLLTIPSTSFHFYWWYEGRKYIGRIWEDWYSCWKLETSLENPRTPVLKRLAGEIAGLGYHVFPFIYEAIKTDKTLERVIVEYNAPAHGAWMISDFETWYSEHESEFVLPKCEGLSTTSGNWKFDKLPTSRIICYKMPKWKEAADSYYIKNSKLTGYWYYRLSQRSDVTDEDIFKAKYSKELEL